MTISHKGNYFESILDSIGNTPVIKLQNIVSPQSADVYVKLEYYNPTGSYKDRMALAMIEEPEKRGEIKPGTIIVEYTGGSTGSSLALVCSVKNYPFKVVSSDAFAQEKLRTMKAFGADLVLVKSEDGKITDDLVPRMIEKAKELANAENTYFTNQLYNKDSVVGYYGIGEELVKQVPYIDEFLGSVGTAGMATGVSKALKDAKMGTKITVLEPAESPVISSGNTGSHSIEGIGIGFVPPLLEDEMYDDVVTVPEAKARKTAKLLAKEEGIFTGPSSGLNIAAAIERAETLDPDQSVTTVAVDFGLKYLAGDLFL